MGYKEILEVIEKTDEILDLNPALRRASEKILDNLMRRTEARGGGILIYDFFDKQLKVLAKQGKLRKATILKSFRKGKIIQRRRELAVPIILQDKKFGLIYLYGKKFSKEEIGYVCASETIMDGRFKHESESVGLRHIFERYVGEKTLKKILEKDGFKEIKSKRQDCSILFADINNFTHFVNTHSSKNIVKFLNTSFEMMSKIVFKKDGTIDKFIGDSVMVIFGSPLPQRDHAKRAIETAQKLINKIRPIINEFHVVNSGLSIGITSGPVVVGNIGSKKMTDYTAIGKKVNLAARLTSIAGKNQILVDETTKKSAKDFRYKLLGSLVIKGFPKPQKIYRVLLK